MTWVSADFSSPVDSTNVEMVQLSGQISSHRGLHCFDSCTYSSDDCTGLRSVGAGLTGLWSSQSEADLAYTNPVASSTWGTSRVLNLISVSAWDKQKLYLFIMFIEKQTPWLSKFYKRKRTIWCSIVMLHLRIYTNIKWICQILWEYMTLILLFIEYFFLCWLSKRIDRGAKTWCTHAALWLAGFIVCQCWSSSVTPCSKHLDFPTSHPVLSPYLSSKALYRRHESRDTHLRISQSPQLFFQASMSDERALSLQSFALEICQLSHYGITETL